MNNFVFTLSTILDAVLDFSKIVLFIKIAAHFLEIGRKHDL